MKLGRKYQMMVTGRSGSPIYLEYPLTVEFEITHHTFAAGNHANFSLYNLSKKHREDLLIDQWFKGRPYPITFNAGYESQQPQSAARVTNTTTAVQSTLPQIFNGFVNIAYTERVGSDLITRINALDNGNVTSDQPSAVFPPNFVIAANTPFSTAVRSMMALLVGVKPGVVVVTPLPKPPASRPWSPTGKVWEVLQTLAPKGGDVFIEDGVCHMLGQNDVLPGVNNLGTLRSDTGLLNIPKYMGYTVECSCIFEPALKIGKYIDLRSDFSPVVNKRYKIHKFTHSGVISGSLSGNATSNISLNALPSPVTPSA